MALDKQTADLINEKLQRIVHIDKERAARVREIHELMQSIGALPGLHIEPTITPELRKPVKVHPVDHYTAKEKPAKEPKQKGSKRSMTDEKRNEILNLNRAGKTDAEIIDEADVSKSTIYRVLQEAGLKSNKGLRKTRKPREDLDDEPATTRRTAMPIAKFQQVKIAISHQVPAETIARELHLTPDEVHKAELAKTYDTYARA